MSSADDQEAAIITEQGAGKRSPLTEYPKQGRAGQGVIGIKIAGGDAVAGFAIVGPKDDVAITTSRGRTKIGQGPVVQESGPCDGRLWRAARR